jgi:hypothetical protein
VVDNCNVLAIEITKKVDWCNILHFCIVELENP